MLLMVKMKIWHPSLTQDHKETLWIKNTFLKSLSQNKLKRVKIYYLNSSILVKIHQLLSATEVKHFHPRRLNNYLMNFLNQTKLEGLVEMKLTWLKNRILNSLNSIQNKEQGDRTYACLEISEANQTMVQKVKTIFLLRQKQYKIVVITTDCFNRLEFNSK